MSEARVIRPAAPVTAHTPATGTIREVCPCHAAYVSGITRDPVLWGAWLRVHQPHGFHVWQEEDA